LLLAQRIFLDQARALRARLRHRASTDDHVYSCAIGSQPGDSTAELLARGVQEDQLPRDGARDRDRVRRGVHGPRRMAILIHPQRIVLSLLRQTARGYPYVTWSE